MSKENLRLYDSLVAEKVMGWKKSGACSIHYNCLKEGGKVVSWEVPRSGKTHTVPAYSSDISAAYEMETEIEKQGLAGKYTLALREIIGMQYEPLNWLNAWHLAHATPLQRVKAALKTFQIQITEDGDE